MILDLLHIFYYNILYILQKGGVFMNNSSNFVEVPCTERKRISLVVPQASFDILSQMAREDNRSLNSYLNVVLQDVVREYLSDVV